MIIAVLCILLGICIGLLIETEIIPLEQYRIGYETGVRDGYLRGYYECETKSINFKHTFLLEEEF